MGRRKLSCITFEVVILSDEGRSCGSRICKNVGIGSGAEPYIVCMLGIVALCPKLVYKPCGKILIH